MHKSFAVECTTNSNLRDTNSSVLVKFGSVVEQQASLIAVITHIMSTTKGAVLWTKRRQNMFPAVRSFCQSINQTII